jgi:hypothetical protein
LRSSCQAAGIYHYAAAIWKPKPKAR